MNREKYEHLAKLISGEQHDEKMVPGYLDWLEGLIDLVDQGKVRQLGVSLPDIQPATGILLAKIGLLASQRVMFNMFEQEPAQCLFREGENTSTAYIARVPFDSGALTGSWNTQTYSEWTADDKRHKVYRGPRFAETLARVERLRALCKPYYQDLSEAALRYSLHDPAVSTVACGMRNKREVEVNTAYSDGEEFPSELLAALRDHAWKHQFYQ